MIHMNNLTKSSNVVLRTRLNSSLVHMVLYILYVYGIRQVNREGKEKNVNQEIVIPHTFIESLILLCKESCL